MTPTGRESRVASRELLDTVGTAGALERHHDDATFLRHVPAWILRLREPPFLLVSPVSHHDSSSWKRTNCSREQSSLPPATP